ncbi:MAG: DMT family transporter [Firmicutes bacterium]|nr:DMT family transporter [Bacillota bacterium]
MRDLSEAAASALVSVYMKNFKFKGPLLLMLTAFIWGSAFVAQRVGTEHIGPFTFNFIRSVLGGLVLIPVILISGRKEAAKTGERGLPFYKDKTLLCGGMLCGFVLCFAMFFQQFGMSDPGCTSGKAAFITTLYIIFVPVAGLFMKKRPSPLVWISILVAAPGMYLLCMSGELKLGWGDISVLCSAVMYTAHIIVIDKFAPLTDCVKMSCIQFFTVALISLPCMLIFERIPSAQSLVQCWLPLAYAGIMSSGVAYTLQIIGQKYTPVSVAPLLMSLESVFAAIMGWILINETMTADQIIGCVMIFGAVILAQVPAPKRKNK